MNKRKYQKAIALMLVGLTLSISGCAAWWANFKKDPVAQVESILSVASTVLNIAQVVFGSIKPSIPADQQAKAQADFDAVMLAANNSVATVQDALQVAEDAKVSNPDFTKVLNDLSTAIAQVQTTIDTYKALVKSGTPGNTGVSVAPTVPGYDTLVARVGILRQRCARPVMN